MSSDIDTLYNLGSDREVRSLGVEVPAWIERDVTCCTVAAILQGGCDSGAYMPAVTYHQAVATMADHDEAILDYLQGAGYDKSAMPDPFAVGWASLACWFVSTAVELWAGCTAELLADLLEAEAEGGGDA